jgi:hypothetical protein
MNPWNDLCNKHDGETGIVIGNGPSLRDIPLHFLKKYPTFGTNRIYLKGGFLPNYYVCVNPLVAGQYLDDIKGMQGPIKFVADQYADQVAGALPLHSIGAPTFSYHPDLRIYEGFTVTYVCLQLAYWMGFSRILLVGVDHFYQYDGRPNEEKVMTGADPNHFSPEYFRGAKWNNPDLDRSESSYYMARTVFEANGRQIINCSTKTALDVFPRAGWEDFYGRS